MIGLIIEKRWIVICHDGREAKIFFSWIMMVEKCMEGLCFLFVFNLLGQLNDLMIKNFDVFFTVESMAYYLFIYYFMD